MRLSAWMVTNTPNDVAGAARASGVAAKPGRPIEAYNAPPESAAISRNWRRVCCIALFQHRAADLCHPSGAGTLPPDAAGAGCGAMCSTAPVAEYEFEFVFL